MKCECEQYTHTDAEIHLLWLAVWRPVAVARAGQPGKPEQVVPLNCANTGEVYQVVCEIFNVLQCLQK